MPEEREVGSGLEEETGVPATPDRRIDDESLRHRCEELDHLPGHHRSVLEAAHPVVLAVHRSASRACCQPPGRTTAVRLSPESTRWKRAE